MAAPTAAEMVTKIDETIAAIVVGQVSEVTMGGRTYRTQDLDKLQGLRDYYLKLSSADDNSASAMLARGVAGIATRR